MGEMGKGCRLIGYPTKSDQRGSQAFALLFSSDVPFEGPQGEGFVSKEERGEEGIRLPNPPARMASLAQLFFRGGINGKMRSE